MELEPRGPLHFDERVVGELRSGKRAAPGFGEHLRPEGFGIPVVHDQVAHEENARDAQLKAPTDFRSNTKEEPLSGQKVMAGLSSPYLQFTTS